MDSCFIIGKQYSLDQIVEGFRFTGNTIPVICRQSGSIKFIKFRAKMNPRWESHGELWIHSGDGRISAAEQWVESNEHYPIFCRRNGTKWEYLGVASAKVAKSGMAAQKHAEQEEVEIIIKLNIHKVETIAVGPKKPTPPKTILRRKVS